MTLHAGVDPSVGKCQGCEEDWDAIAAVRGAEAAAQSVNRRQHEDFVADVLAEGVEAAVALLVDGKGERVLPRAHVIDLRRKGGRERAWPEKNWDSRAGRGEGKVVQKLVALMIAGEGEGILPRAQAVELRHRGESDGVDGGELRLESKAWRRLRERRWGGRVRGMGWREQGTGDEGVAGHRDSTRLLH
jgi:hypothetical protein